MPSPVTVSIEVARPRQQVFDFVNAIANHEAIFKTLYKDWSFEGRDRGVGAVAKAQVDAPAAREKVTFKVTESLKPELIVEEVESAHGKRETRNTYRFTKLEAGRTRVEFELEWVKVPRTEKLAPPVSRAFMARAYGKALKRLASLIEEG
jgi:ribosome-associated toxin RatA of RatAB toxin-antitoxin module